MLASGSLLKTLAFAAVLVAPLFSGPFAGALLGFGDGTAAAQTDAAQSEISPQKPSGHFRGRRA